MTCDADMDGRSQLEIKYHGAIDTALSVVANATVTDINKIVHVTTHMTTQHGIDCFPQAQQTSVQFVLHHTSLFVGFKSDHYYAKPKQPVPMHVIVVDIQHNNNGVFRIVIMFGLTTRRC